VITAACRYLSSIAQFVDCRLAQTVDVLLRDCP
jgi:hypothetical protein